MPIHCPVCRMPAGSPVAVCTACETPHHPECWEFGRGCAIFACGGSRARQTTVDELEARAVPVVHLDGTEPDPPWLRRARRGDFPAPLDADGPAPAPPLGSAASRDSAAVVAVSWLYLAASLVLAIPAAGFVVKAVSRADGLSLASAGICGSAALLVKWVGDLIAVGDRRGRTVHLWGAALIAIGTAEPALSLLLAGLCVPFGTRRGSVHFGSSPGA